MEKLPVSKYGDNEAGCDEAGRGCLAGPVVAAAVILPSTCDIPGLNDSKKLSEKRRNELAALIKKHALAWEIQFIPPERIDEINILNASFEAMALCVQRMDPVPQLALIDGNRFTSQLPCQFECIIGGDGQYANIAAASILAKTSRDQYMMELDREFPMYGWRRNKGYPTRQHRQAIVQHGTCKYHRQSFTLYPRQIELNFSHPKT